MCVEQFDLVRLLYISSATEISVHSFLIYFVGKVLTFLSGWLLYVLAQWLHTMSSSPYLSRSRVRQNIVTFPLNKGRSFDGVRLTAAAKEQISQVAIYNSSPIPCRNLFYLYSLFLWAHKQKLRNTFITFFILHSSFYSFFFFQFRICFESFSLSSSIPYGPGSY